jgi:hypothetical protein
MSKTTKRPGRPRKSSADKKLEYLDVRLDIAEKQTFDAAAQLAGLPLSAWVRERLRRVAIEELQGARLDVPILR